MFFLFDTKEKRKTEFFSTIQKYKNHYFCDIEPIASQLIELGRKKSSDNISVIAVFFKDPKQIVAEYKARGSDRVENMDFESANGLHHLDDGLVAGNNECATKVDALTMESNDFYFGKNGSDTDFQATDLRSNGDGDKFSSNDAIDDDHDDFGPETDVDATDDNAISPTSPSQGYDFIERVNDDASVDDHQMDYVEEIVKKSEDIEQHQFDDNRFVENLTEHLIHTTADVNVHVPQQLEHFVDEDDDEPELANKIDFAEKNEFRCDDDDEDDDDDDEGMNRVESVSDVIATEYERHVLPTNNSVPIQNVVVESGDDSDDEWDYVKVNKEEKSKAEQHREFVEHEQQASEKQFNEDEITSPTPPTASLGEADFIEPEESHAEAQALAEPEEACSELIDERKEIDSDDADIEIERAVSDPAGFGSELGNDQEEDMDSSLNPEAKEFVPVSPQRSIGSPPLGSGINAMNRPDLLEDDIVSQSPRKGSTCVMDDIILPGDNDFSEISQRPSELKPEDEENGQPLIVTSSATVQLDFDSVEVNQSQRPESSSSQCSYQEMNLKEAMHGDEKQELAAEGHDGEYAGDNHLATNGGEHQNDFLEHLLGERDPMKMSVYNDGSETGAFENNPFTNADVDMNAVQMLPDTVYDEDNKENETQNHFENGGQQPSNEQIFNQFENQEHEELAKESASDSEKLTLQQQEFGQFDEQALSQQFEQQSTIAEVVQQMATEVTSVLNDFQPEHNEQNGQQFIQQDYSENNEIPQDVIKQSELSVAADEFTPKYDFGFDSVQQSNEYSIQSDQPFVQIEQTIEKAPVEEVQSEPAPVAAEPLVEVEPVEQIKDDNATNEVIAAAAATATVAALASKAAATKSAKSPAKSVTATKKPLSAVAAKKPTTVASKVAPKPAAKVEPKATSVAASRVAAARAAAPKLGEKKTTTSTTTTRKPLSNGVTSTITKKTSTTTTATKPAPITRPATAPVKTATSRTVSSTTTAAKTSTAPKTSTTAAPRVPLSARSAPRPATATSTASKVGAAKPAAPAAASRLKSAAATTTTRTTTLTKPKSSLDKPVTTTRTTVTRSSPLKTLTSTTTTVKRSPISKTTTTTTTTITATKKLTPSKKPITLTSKTTPSKSPKVPLSNGVAKTKTAAKTNSETTANGTEKGLNGHGVNGSADNAIIDLSAD